MKSNSGLKFLLGCFLMPFFIACSEENDRKLEKSCIDNEVEISEINPNGDSELALLMRKMAIDVDSLKQLIINKKGTISNELITELERIHTAIPTDANVKTPQFEAFNNLLISQAKTLKENPYNRIESFNQFINRCIDCHNSFCPGPIVRIKKLKIIYPN